jgi:hypothetical protein
MSRAHAHFRTSRRLLPIHEGSTFTREAFDTLIALEPGAKSFELRLSEEDTIFIGAGEVIPNVVFVRRLVHGLLGTTSYLRIFIYDVDGVLRTTASGDDDRKMIDEMHAASAPIIAARNGARARDSGRDSSPGG